MAWDGRGNGSLHERESYSYSRRDSSKLCAPHFNRGYSQILFAPVSPGNRVQSQISSETISRVGGRASYVRGGTIKVTDTVIQFVNELPVGKPRLLLRESKQPPANWEDASPLEIGIPTTGSKNIPRNLHGKHR